jgi:hypothetical protein
VAQRRRNKRAAGAVIREAPSTFISGDRLASIREPVRRTVVDYDPGSRTFPKRRARGASPNGPCSRTRRDNAGRRPRRETPPNARSHRDSSGDVDGAEIGWAADALRAPLRHLIATGWPYHVPVPSVARPVDGEVEPGIAQTHFPVGATGHHAGVRVALPVVGPETDRAGRAPGPVATAGTPADRWLDHAGKPPTPTHRQAPRPDCGSDPIGPRTDMLVGGPLKAHRRRHGQPARPAQPLRRSAPADACRNVRIYADEFFALGLPAPVATAAGKAGLLHGPNGRPWADRRYPSRGRHGPYRHRPDQRERDTCTATGTSIR